jgi:hypothetical protein
LPAAYIERDFLAFKSGGIARIQVAERRANLVGA